MIKLFEDITVLPMVIGGFIITIIFGAFGLEIQGNHPIWTAYTLSLGYCTFGLHKDVKWW